MRDKTKDVYTTLVPQLNYPQSHGHGQGMHWRLSRGLEVAQSSYSCLILQRSSFGDHADSRAAKPQAAPCFNQEAKQAQTAALALFLEKSIVSPVHKTHQPHPFPLVPMPNQAGCQASVV